MNRPTLLSRLVRHVLLALYRLRGWHVEGRAPPMPKFIVVGVYAVDMARIAAFYRAHIHDEPRLALIRP